MFNPKTQRVSPQYHIIDDYFHTVPLLACPEHCDKTFESLFQSNAAEKSVDDSDICQQVITGSGPFLSDDLLDDTEL